ncbi:MAG TPA: MBL fold metallo-hydrolase, partial [Thermoanaerobaculia bacterium]
SQLGGGKPQLELVEVESAFDHEGVEIVPIPVAHGNWTIFGYRIGKFAYITDTNGIPPASIELLRGVDILCIDGLRPSPPHPTHFTVDEAIAAARSIGAGQVYLIHIAHEIDHQAFEATLPADVRLAYDGLRLEI